MDEHDRTERRLSETRFCDSRQLPEERDSSAVGSERRRQRSTG